MERTRILSTRHCILVLGFIKTTERGPALCYDQWERPPYPPVRGGADDRGDLILTSADGSQFMAYYAHPSTPSDKAMVVFPGAGGLREFFMEFAVRLAEAGFHAVTIDYYGRTAPLEKRGPKMEDFDNKPHLAQLSYANVDADGQAAVAWLRALPGVNLSAIFSVGFCIGGGFSWRQSASPGFNGAIGFYGIPRVAEDRIDEMTKPLLILAGGADTNAPLSDVEPFAEKVKNKGVEVEMHVYENAPHNFFHLMADDYQAYCDDAWKRVIEFANAHS